MSRPNPSRRPASLTALSALVAAAVVLSFAFIPAARQAYREAAMNAAFETAAALAALLAANLLGGRAARTRSRRDLLLACGFSTLALGNVGFGAIPAALSRDTDFLIWGQALTAAAGGLLLAWAVTGARGTVRRPWLGAWTVPVTALALTGAITVVAAGCAGSLDGGIDRTVPSQEAALFAGNPLLIALNLASGVGFAAAAFGGARLAHRDPLLAWAAAGSALAAGARVTYAMALPMSTAWALSGDLLRLGFYLLLLVGGAFEIRSYQRSLITAAVVGERRRIARDVHDGLAQELSFITLTAGEARERAGDEDLALIETAARRAMVESRALLETLLDESAECDLEASVRQVAALHGVEARCDIEATLRLDSAERRELERIAVEAVHNAARHGGARSVRVQLAERGGRIQLRVTDDGAGFDVGAVAHGRFGLTSMRERAQALGGRLRIDAGSGQGTTVEVVVP